MILPQNINEIDNQLKKIYYSNRHLKVYAKNGNYAHKFLVQMKQRFELNYKICKSKYESNFILIKEKVSIKQKILHNQIVYKIGMFLFPKGSKLRQILKSRL